MFQDGTEPADRADRLNRSGPVRSLNEDERGGVSRRSLLRLSMAGAGVLASGPALAKTGLVGGQPGAVEQALVPGVISGSAPMRGPNVPKFQREMLLMP